MQTTTTQQQTVEDLRELCEHFARYGQMGGTDAGKMERLARQYARQRQYVRDPRLDRPTCRMCDNELAGGDSCPEHNPNDH